MRSRYVSPIPLDMTEAKRSLRRMETNITRDLDHMSWRGRLAETLSRMTRNIESSITMKRTT